MRKVWPLRWGLSSHFQHDRSALRVQSNCIFSLLPPFSRNNKNQHWLHGENVAAPVCGSMHAPFAARVSLGPFRTLQSALNLAAARLRHVAGTEWSTKRYLSMDFLKDHQPTRDNRLSPAGAAQPNIKVRKTLDATDSGSAFATVSQRYVGIRPALWVSTKCFDRADIDREMTTCETRDGRIACFVGNVAKIKCCLLAKEHTEEASLLRDCHTCRGSDSP
jgi:hypothetical protein